MSPRLNFLVPKILILFFLINIFLSKFSYSQISNYQFLNFGQAHGLSQVTIQTVIQDRNGIIWVGTQDGLNRFDGYFFKVFKNDNLDTTSLSDNWVYAIFEDSKRNLWVGTNNGLNLFDSKTQTFRRFFNNPKDTNSLPCNLIRSVYEDKSGNLWIGTWGGGLCRFNYESGIFEKIPYEKKGNSLSNRYVFTIKEDRFGKIWVGTYNGLNSIDINSRKITNYIFDEKNKDGIGGKSVTALEVDKDDNLWIGFRRNNPNVQLFNIKKNIFFNISSNYPLSKLNTTVTVIHFFNDNCVLVAASEEGLIYFNYKTEEYFQFKKENSLLQSNSIRFISEDFAGNVLLGTGRGLSILANSLKFNKLIVSIKNQDKKEINPTIWAFAEDIAMNIFFGTVGNGLIIKNLKNEVKEFNVTNSKLTNNTIVTLFFDCYKKLWLGTYKFCNMMDVKSGKIRNFTPGIGDKETSHERILCFAQNDSNNLYLGTFGAGISVYNYKLKKFKHHYSVKNDTTTLSNPVINSLFFSSDNLLWIATDGGLNVFDPSVNKIYKFIDSTKYPAILNTSSLTSISEDVFGNIWVGSLGNGLFKINRKNGALINITERDGLSNNTINSMFFDNKANLWISTNKGISRYNIISKIFRNYGISDGLQSWEFTANVGYQNKHGWIYFGGTDGVNYFHPDSIKDNTIPPRIMFTGFKIFNSDVNPLAPKLQEEWGVDTTYNEIININNKYFLTKDISQTHEIILSHHETVFSFEFVALHYSFSEKNKYAYKMENFEKNWNYVGTQRSATYTNLDPGTYYFRVIAANCDGVWNREGIFIKIIITPPFWQTTWFIVLFILFVIALVVFIVKFRERNLKRQKIKLELKVKERTAELRKRYKEIKEQRNEIAYQKAEIEEQKAEIEAINESLLTANVFIEAKNKSLTDSVRYARRIQQAILPDMDVIQNYFPESFVIYMPKAIVSGDLYWVHKHADFVFFAAIDCTGHGVPGAFMSIIANNLLNQAINEYELIHPSSILSHIRHAINKELRNTDDDKNLVQDGMDIALCTYFIKESKIEYSGVYNPLILVRDGNLYEYKADKYPASIYVGAMELGFNQHTIDVKTNDAIYLYSDGYQDQFGWKTDRKFMPARFKETLKKIASEPMNEQKQMLISIFEHWKGDLEQLDDIVVLGVRI